jgi:hypothetical protein
MNKVYYFVDTNDSVVKSHIMPLKAIVFVLFLLFPGFAFSQQYISITDFGAHPGNRSSVVRALREALKEAAGFDSAVLVFPTGRYDFWPDFSSDEPTIGIKMDNLRNFILDGHGSEFVFHGNMVVASLRGCENISLRNFNVDWDHPFIYQGQYVATTADYIDVKFDTREYPYVIEDSLFYLTGEGWRARPDGFFNLFDKDTKEIMFRTYDGNNESVYSSKASEIEPGTVRFHHRPDITPEPGTITVISAGTYITDCIQIFESRNVFLKDITVYHGLSTGIYGQRSENITLDNVNITANEKKGRVFSVIADASHFTNCKGLIKVTNCSHTGQGDDWINVRGRYTPIVEISNKFSVTTSMGRQSPLFTPGDEIWFLNHKTTQRFETRTIQSMKALITNGKTTGFYVTFNLPLPDDVQAGDFIENKTWNPRVEIRNCKILKKHRARGILVTTPEKVVIENNYFRTAGTAILIEGDINFWYESGSHTDLTIRGNVFEDCLTSGNSSGSRAEWGEAIITITPSHLPENKSEPYHKNIRIENNIFKTFDTPLMRARSVRGLSFMNNEIIRTYTYNPYAWQKSSFLLDGCRDVVITGNRIDNAYATRTIEMDHMKKSDLKVEGFSVMKQ